MHKYKILFVDDEPEILDGLRRNMHKMLNEWDLFYTSNGEEALAMTAVDNFDLIITDARMPNMTGGELVVELKGNTLTCDIPVMMLTGYADETIKNQALDNGVIEFFYKPILPDELIMRIKNILKFKKLNNDLKELNKQKNHFLGIAAHDLRNPLHVIMSIVGLYKIKYENELDNYQSQKLDDILKEVRFMTELIEDFLDIAAIESGKFSLNKQKIMISALFKDSLEFYQELAKNKNIELEFFSIDTVLHEIIVDANKINQAVGNLLTNAVKFSHPGGRIIFTVEKKYNETILSVQDFGQGIPLGEQETLFKPFMCTSVNTTAGEKSTGLGLAIVKKIVEAHQGSVKMESEAGKGSTFTISLPDVLP